MSFSVKHNVNEICHVKPVKRDIDPALETFN